MTSRLFVVKRIGCVLGATLLLAVPASAAVSIHVVRLTASYSLTLSVGPKETMYTAAEVKAKHPTSGEVMLDDSMSTGGMSMGAGNRHLEVQVKSRKTNKVLSLMPSSITFTDTSAMSSMATPDKLHVVAMYGVEEGMAELHYGNNVKLTAGHMYKVVVTVKGEKATFNFKA
jgi:hypothetical protein